jgi:leucyl aminopeptidase
MEYRADSAAAALRGRDPMAAFVFEDEKEATGPFGGLKELVAQAAQRDRFKGEKDAVARVLDPRSRVVALAGLGKRKDYASDRLRTAAAAAARALKHAGKRLNLGLPGIGKPAEEAHVAAEGAGLALYDFDRYKTKKDPPAVRAICVVSGSTGRAAEGARRAAAYVRATTLVRDLVNEPAMVMTPRRMAEEARAVARRSGGRVRVRVMDEREILRRRMAGLRGVSLGSGQPPRFVHMTYRAPRSRKVVALVGKGITFDSGGLDIKTADNMATMKDDMAGAGAVIGVMSALADRRPAVTVHGIFAATENVIGPHAYKPGDVLTYANGKTVEIGNTDAEGRLVLADALIYACALKPHVIIDIATLTGACVVALGQKIAGLFTPDDKLSRELIHAGNAAGEVLWRMPVHEPYFENIKSKVAHMNNSGPRWAGAINAALFLREFVKGPAWAHLDIAGPAFGESNGPIGAPGATGFAVRTLLHYLEG